MKKVVIQDEFIKYKANIDGFINDFETKGIPFGNQDRNSLKLFQLNDLTLNIKSFRIPNLINQFAYKFFRKSKAQRSFEYANKLLELKIGTPQPIAYFEYSSPFLFGKSFYVSEQVDCDLTYRELTKDFNIPDYDTILRAFTRFTYSLHQKNIHFLDHSPGNTLIKKVGNEYKFYLVDLNRMKFEPMDFETKIKNFSRLTIHKSMVEVMSNEYAKCSGENYTKIFDLMWKETEAFQAKYYRKQRLKKKLSGKK